MSLIKPWPQEPADGSPSPPPRRPDAGTGDDEADDGGAVTCTAVCLPFPRFLKKKRPALNSRKSARKAEPASARRVNSSWWPWSPSYSTSGDAAAAAGASTLVDDDDDDDGSASFKHWGQPQGGSRSLLSRVTPRASSSSLSFSFPSSPASASSLVSTPRMGP